MSNIMSPKDLEDIKNGSVPSTHYQDNTEYQPSGTKGVSMNTPKTEPSNCPKCGAKMKISYACGEYFIFPIGIKGCSICGNRKMRASEEQVLLEWESDVLWYMENCK